MLPAAGFCLPVGGGPGARGQVRGAERGCIRTEIRVPNAQSNAAAGAARVRTAIFLVEGGCGIHPAKPTQCRIFPFWPELVDHPRAWAKTARYCPGIGKGPLIQIKSARAQAEEMRAEHPEVVPVGAKPLSGRIADQHAALCNRGREDRFGAAATPAQRDTTASVRKFAVHWMRRLESTMRRRRGRAGTRRRGGSCRRKRIGSTPA